MELTSISDQKSKKLVGTRYEKLGDGCYHVFLDVGSNIGVHARFIYEPHQYPEVNKGTKEIFAQHFGKPETRNPRNVCVFAFEPNPNHKKRHLDLREAYGNLGLRYHPLFVGVSDLDGTLNFYHQDDTHKSEWGFSARKVGRKNAEEKVKVIRLSAWLKKHIYEREIPDKPLPLKNHENITGHEMPPKVVMKLDVEGMEIIMLPDLLFSGSLCQTVDYVFGEFHRFGIPVEPNEVTGHGGINVDFEEYMNVMLASFHSLRNDDCKCKKIDVHDDESYLLDGIPLPSSAWWTEA